MHAPEILCLGEPMVEFCQTDDANWQQGVGGDVSNVAIAAARLGARAGLIAAVGDDAFGQDLRDVWATEGVDDRWVKTDSHAPTGLYFIRQQMDGHVFEYRRKGSAASRLTPADLPREVIGQADFLHLSGITLAISDTARQTASEALELARAAGRKTAFDPNLRLALWSLETAQTECKRIAARSDIVLPGLDDARQLTGLHDPGDIARYYLGLGPAIVALTMGADGALLATADGLTHIPAPTVNLVDASGAGDCFDGAFLTRLSRGDTPIEAANYAVAASALSVQGFGAVHPLPHIDAVQAAL